MSIKVVQLTVTSIVTEGIMKVARFMQKMSLKILKITPSSSFPEQQKCNKESQTIRIPSRFKVAENAKCKGKCSD